MLLFILGNFFQFAVCAAALWLGGREERTIGAALLVNTAISKMALSNRWTQPEYAVLTADLALTAVLFVISMRTGRWWILWCAAFELLTTVTHVAIIVDPSVRGPTYRASMIIWSYMVLFALAAGTWTAARNRATRPS
ncbi:MAG TPA: hypothetical protein VIO94_01610 [Phenylobacterium sp.]